MKKRKKKVKVKFRRLLMFILVFAMIVYVSISFLDLSGYSGESRFPEEVFGTIVYTQLVEKGTEARPRDSSQNQIYCNS